MSRPVPPQVIPRPPTWRPGAPAPWADVALVVRTGLSLDRVIGALEAGGQCGPVPDHIGPDHMFGAAVVVNESTMQAPPHVNAAVLAVLFEEAGESRVVLTRRSSRLRTHRGEVSFPGGRIEEGEGPWQAAMREASEEVDLDPALVTAVGWINPVMTLVSASLIMPVLATVEARPTLVANPAEVERIFDVTLAELADPAVFHEERWSVPGRAVAGSADDSFPVWFFEVSGEMIWGATARMLYELLSIVLTQVRPSS